MFESDIRFLHLPFTSWTLAKVLFNLIHTIFYTWSATPLIRVIPVLWRSFVRKWGGRARSGTFSPLMYQRLSGHRVFICFGRFFEDCTRKSRFFLLRRNNPAYTWGPLGCLLGFWTSGPKPYGGNNLRTWNLESRMFLRGFDFSY